MVVPCCRSGMQFLQAFTEHASRSWLRSCFPRMRQAAAISCATRRCSSLLLSFAIMPCQLSRYAAPLALHTIGLWAVLITTSLLGHHAMPVVTVLCHGMMAQQASSDEDSPKTNRMNSKHSKMFHPCFLLLVSRLCSSSLLCTNIVPC